MTTKEAFTIGFLSRLAERGVMPSQFEKKADLGATVSALSPLALAALIGIPAATGAVTGWAHAGLTDVSEEDIDRMKTKDRIATYRSEAKRIRRKLNRAAWRKPEPRRSPAEDF